MARNMGEHRGSPSRQTATIDIIGAERPDSIGEDTNRLVHRFTITLSTLDIGECDQVTSISGRVLQDLAKRNFTAAALHRFVQADRSAWPSTDADKELFCNGGIDRIPRQHLEECFPRQRSDGDLLTARHDGPQQLCGSV